MDTSSAEADAATSHYLNRPAALQWAPSCDATKWLSETRTLFQLIESHPLELDRATQKDGRAFIQGTLAPGKIKRVVDDVAMLELIGFDIDYGPTWEPVIAAAKARGGAPRSSIRPSPTTS